MDDNAATAERDEFFEAQVARALKPYRQILTAERLAALEAMVRDTLENDPIAAELLRAARPRTPPLKTSERDVPGVAPAARKEPADGEK